MLEDTFTKVTIKRVEKDKHMKKMEKDTRENLDTKIDERKQKDEHKQDTFKEIMNNKKKKEQQWKMKFKNMDKSKDEINHSFAVFKQSLREMNMFKKLDQDCNMDKLKRGRSAYKAQLVESIIEKGSRGKEINERKNRVAQMAYLSQAGIRS